MHPEFGFKFLLWSQKLRLKKVHLQLGVLWYFICSFDDRANNFAMGVYSVHVLFSCIYENKPLKPLHVHNFKI